MFPRTCILSK